jgi:hypothetical protein
MEFRIADAFTYSLARLTGVATHPDPDRGETSVLAIRR